MKIWKRRQKVFQLHHRIRLIDRINLAEAKIDESRKTQYADYVRKEIGI